MMPHFQYDSGTNGDESGPSLDDSAETEPTVVQISDYESNGNVYFTFSIPAETSNRLDLEPGDMLAVESTDNAFRAQKLDL